MTDQRDSVHATSIPNPNGYSLIGPDELLDCGYVQEVNRRFFHPLGLALAVDRDKVNLDGSFPVQVWDYRDDPEGFLFADLTDDAAAGKADSVRSELLAKADVRRKVLEGCWSDQGSAIVQTIGSAPSPIGDAS